MRRVRRHRAKDRGFNFRDAAAVLRPELLPLLPPRDCDDEMLPFERESSPLNTADMLNKDLPK